MKRIAITIGLLAFFLSGWGNNAPIRFHTLDISNGLSQNSVIDIVQDSIGYIWFATQDGLNRYDGYQFKYYEKYFWDYTQPKKILLGSLLVDSNGILWILPDTGIPERYNVAEDTFEAIPNLSDIHCFFEDDHGNIYFGSNTKGLFQYSTLQHTPKQIYQEQVQGGLSLSANKLLIFADGKVVLFNKDKAEQTYPFLDKKKAIISPLITCLLEDSNGTIWAGTFGNGLFYKKEASSYFKPAIFDASVHTDALKILSLQEDKYQNIWIGTYGNGALLYNPSKSYSQQFSAKKQDPYAISYNDILTIYKDQNEVIWLGTDGAGVSFYDEDLSKFNGFTNEQTPSHIKIDVVRSLLVDKHQNTWIGTSGKGLTLYKKDKTEETWHTYTEQNSNLSSNRIMSITEVGESIWIGTQGGGLNIFNTKNRTFQVIPIKETVCNTIWDSYMLTKQRCLLATRNEGIIEYDLNKGVLNVFNEAQGLPSNNIRKIVAAADSNQFWIGTENKGICHFDQLKGQFISYPNPNSNNKIKSLYLADNGILWIGTNGNGLEAFDTATKQFYQYGIKDGLPNNVIYGILPDEKGHLWLSSNRGLCLFIPPVNIADSLSKPQVRVYDNNDGLQSFEFNTGAYYKDRQGVLYFGGIKGYNWFNPNEIQANPNPPSVFLTDLLVNGESYLYQGELQETGKIQLKYSQNDIAFRFATTSFSIPERTAYRYQLKGYDENEITSSNRNFTQYTNLPPNDYQFQIQASNYDGVWNTKGITIPIQIRPPWYATWWAYLFYTCCMLGIATGIYQFQKRRWQLNTQLSLEQAEAARFKELNRVKSHLYANITHEFRTPLTVILGLTGILLEETKSAARRHLTIIQNNGKQLLNLINQLLELSKLEAKASEVQYVQGDIIAYLKYLLESFDSLAKAQNKKLLFICSRKEFLMDFDAPKIQRIISNLLSNAFKFTEEKGTITVSASIEKEDQEFVLKIEDTGIGIAKEQLAHVFDRFYQVDTSSTRQHDGTGIGLSLVKELVLLLKGTIEIESKVKVGTTFRLTFPVTRSASLEEVVAVKELKMEAIHPIMLPDNKFDLSEDQSPSILIIEDNRDVVNYLKTCLSEKYQLLFAFDGQKGIDLALQHIPDLIISDLMMPEKDGYEVCDTLKNKETTSHIPIILLTAKASYASRLEGLRKGADVYLIKPFKKEELFIRLDQLLTTRKKIQQYYAQVHKQAPLHLPKEDKFLQKVNSILEAHLSDEAFKTPQLCKVLLYSKMQVHRKIKALTNLSTSEYMRQYRLKQAKNMLDKGEDSISEIAYAVGFSSLQYFSRSFKQVYDCSPTEYLKRSQ